MAFTHSATLPIGVFYKDQRHRDFTVRISTISDEIAVVEEGIPDSGTIVGVLARCITELGSIPAEEITYGLLCDTLVSEDFKVLRDAQLEAKKKLSALKPPPARLPFRPCPTRTVPHPRRPRPPP
ncbi:MAG: hypothetical protein ACR5LG_12125 [Sodalis sp. (in: enterobacteria)]|uniref:hypothetical protein n=1 Tax=Sodalis sp. (in: enterobacteria) TaxID=1898979 RepID=UPI003F2C86D6